MRLTFDGQTHSIDANTLINSLLHYQTVINAANNVHSGGSREISLKVNAIEKGSFVVDISLVQNVVQQIFSHDAISYIADLSAIVGGVFWLYRKFKGYPAKDGAKIDLEIKNTNVTINQETIISVYNMPIVREAVSKTIETADNDPSVEGVKFDNEATASTSFAKEEFKDYIYTDFDSEVQPPEDRIDDVEAMLVITTLSFEKGSRWQFIYNGFKIAIIVKDDALMREIDNGARFGKGDAIRVKLRIMKRYNAEYKAYENKSYKILEFYEHLKAAKQQELFLKN